MDDVVPEGEDSANRLEKKFKNNVNRPAIFVRDALEKSLESQIKYISEIEFVSTKWKVSEQLLEKCSVQNWKGN